MKLAEIYSLGSGLKLNKPDLYTQFVPLFDNPYIVIHAGGGNGNFDSKIYNYYQEVINLIKPIITPLNYKIIQIGTSKDEQLQGVDLNLCGKTNIWQTNFIIKKCALFLGNDSVCAHTAGLFGVPMVSLYGATSVANHAPYWHNKDKSIFLESDRNGKTCTFSMQESPKTVNMIYPEKVVMSIFNILDLKWPEPIKTLFIGNGYKNSKIELIPNQVVKPSFFNGIATIRGDYYFNEENIISQLKLNECILIISQPINIEKLKEVKNNLKLLLLKVDNFPDIQSYISLLKENLIGFGMVTSIQDNEELNKLKLNLYEYGAIQKFPSKDKKDLEFINNVNYNTTRLKTNTLILSNQKVYASYAHYLANSPCTLQNTESKLLNTNAFFNDIENFWIYTKE